MRVDPAAFSTEASASAVMAMINWYEVLLYPAGFKSDDLTFQAELRLPQHWRFGTALPLLENGNPIKFGPLSLTTLADSPLVPGVNYRHIQLPDSPPTTQMEIAADTPPALHLPPAHTPPY